MRFIYSLVLFSFLLFLSSCKKEESQPYMDDALEIRSSTLVTMFHSDSLIKQWLNHPDKAYFECYFLMPANIAEDVIVGLDIEYGEGNGQTPLYFENSQWATIVGLSRDGILFYNCGTQKSYNGIPEDGNFKGLALNQPILAENWYRLRTVVDFKERKYVSVEVEGPNIDTTLDLSANKIEFTMKIPFNQRNLTFYVLALRNIELANGNKGETTAYFDKVEGGIWWNNSWIKIFQDGFEKQSSFTDVPATLPTVLVENFMEGKWYLENDNALVEISKKYTLEGNQSAVCNARLY